MPAPISKPSQELEARLRRLAVDPEWGVTRPLPPVRDLAQEHGVSHTTPYRILGKLHRENLVWQHSNGRFFQAAARERMEKLLPNACLLRHLEIWSACYQEVMQGFSEACGGQKRGMLLIHNDQLVQHANLEHPPAFGSVASQTRALADFFKTQSSPIHGVLLDDVWQDSVLKKFESQLSCAAVVNRPTDLPFLSSVLPDHEMGGVLAIAHLLARGYREIWVAVPFSHYIPAELTLQSAVNAARNVGCVIPPSNIIPASTPRERQALVDKLKASGKRVGLICVEDNVTTLLLTLLNSERLAVPDQVGLISCMGSRVSMHRGITCLHMNYEEVGRRAAEILREGKAQAIKLPVSLVHGKTT